MNTSRQNQEMPRLPASEGSTAPARNGSRNGFMNVAVPTVADRSSSCCFPAPELYLPPPLNNVSEVPDLPEDAELLARTARGDTAALARLYDRHSGLLFSLVVHILRDRHEAEDVLQEAFLQIWERAPLYDPTLGKPMSWLVSLTRNKAIDRFRKRRRAAETVAQATAAAEVWPTHVPADEAHAPQAQDDAALIRRALMELSAAQRQAIELAFLSGLTHLEIAEKLATPAGTIKARIRRGMMTMRDALEGQL